MRTFVNQVESAIASGDKEEARAAFARGAAGNAARSQEGRRAKAYRLAQIISSFGTHKVAVNRRAGSVVDATIKKFHV